MIPITDLYGITEPGVYRLTQPQKILECEDRIFELCQLFKKATDSTVLEFLTQIRLAEAKTLLVKFPDKTLSQIAGMCGFESSSYFCYVFKKHEKMPPVQFRQARR